MELIKNLFHASLQVDDFDKTLDFYCNKLEMDQMFVLKVADFRDILGMHDSDKNNDVNWLTYIRVAPEQYLEVFNNAINPPEFDILPIRHDRSQALHSFALGCEDVEKTLAVLAERGIPSENGYITDPTGCKVRIVERKSAFSMTKPRLFNCLAGISLYVNDLKKMSEYLQNMGMKKAGETETSVCLLLGEYDQYLELIQSPEPVITCDADMLGHIALQIYSIADVVWNWGKAGVRCCMQPMMKDDPFEVKEGVEGNYAVDGCEIVWVVSQEGNKYEIMRQPGNTIQQQFEREHPF